MDFVNPTPSAVHPIHLEGASVDHVEWMPVPFDDGFDAEAMEAAMIEARADVYRVLAEIDAA